MEANERLQALFYTVLRPHDLVMAASDTTTLLHQFLHRLLGEGVFQAAAVLHHKQVVLQEGTPGHNSVMLASPITRGGNRWGALRVWINPSDSADIHVQELIRWAGAVLGQSFDLWDARMQLQQETVHQRYRATHDDLTGLENRMAFLTHLPNMLEQAQRDHKLLVIGVLDLDDFKPVNDTYGHAAGDNLLRDWSRRLLTWLHTPHRVARIGGDEFLFVLSGFTQISEAEAFLETMVTDLAAPIPLPQGTEVTVHISIGLTVTPDDTGDPDGLIRHADWALYRSKELKHSREHSWVWYRTPMNRISCFHAAIPSQLCVHYQPIVDGHTGHVQSLEALVRLQDGSRLLAPAQFLPQLSPAELETLTFGVLDHVLTDLGQLDRDASSTAHHLSVALNLEPSMLSPTCIDHIEAQVRHAAVDPRRITLELLETSDFLSKDLAKSQLRILKQRQFQLALDDVGSAYSSLLRIKELPIDTFKLDQAFVRHIPEDPDDLLFVISIQTLARGFQAHFIAEGVETPEILDALQVLGVDRIQGYVFTPPLALPDLLSWITSYIPRPAMQQPQSLLGAYAAHLAYQFLDQVLPLAVVSQTITRCPLTRYLRNHGLEHLPLAQEHERYHARWYEASPDTAVRQSLKEALIEAMAQPGSQLQPVLDSQADNG